MLNLLIKFLGQSITVLISDPAAFDRWLWLRRNIKKGSVKTLDAGCGSGALTLYAANAGNDALGISFDKRNNEVAAKRAELLNLKNAKFIDGDLRKLDELSAAPGAFDQIICFETIEHILDDKKLIRDFSKILKPGGQLLIATPYKYYRRFPGDQIFDVETGGHVRWGYTHEEMRKLIESQNFKVVKEEYVTGFISQMLCRLIKFFDAIFPHLGWLVAFPLRIFQFLDPIVDKFYKYPKLSIAVAAVKI